MTKKNTDITESSPSPPKKLFLETWGCQMNIYDSVLMSDALEGQGYVRTNTPDDADLVLLNTCHIRDKAAQKVYSRLGKIRKIKEERKKTKRPMMVGVAGCVAQAEGEEIIRREPSVDIVVGPQSAHLLPSMVQDANKKPQIALDFLVDEKFRGNTQTNLKKIQARGVTAFLTVQEGCDKFCTFCVVPYTRGKEVSRNKKDICEEAQRLVDAGVREITLLGQNVNAWHGVNNKGKPIGLGELLRELANIPSLARLRYVTSHPCDMDDELIAAHKDLNVLMPYLHLPVQSGSDVILKKMNRKHTAQDYINIIKKVRQARPDIAISGDLIVGFPSETEKDFEQTLNLVREIEYAQCFSFKYSPRPGTPGAEMENQIDDSTKKERLARLQSLINEQQKAFNQKCIGKVIDVLIEKSGRHEGQFIGRSPWLQSVIVPSEIGNIGDITTVEVTDANPNSLIAQPIKNVA